MRYPYARRGLLLWSPVPVLRFEEPDASGQNPHYHLDFESRRALERLRDTWHYRHLRELEAETQRRVR